VKARLYRRSPSLVAYWVGAEIVVHDFVGHVRRPVGSAGLAVLASLDTWRSAGDVERRTGLTASETRRVLGELCEHSIVEAAENRPDSVKGLLPAWDVWGPEATFFHFGTRDGTPPPRGVDALDGGLARMPRPETLKETTGRRPIALPAYPRTGAFVDVLMARRSWRRFGKDAIGMEQLATLLGLTWGVQSWMAVAPGVRAALKTSPSGGACHSLEVYVLAQRVRGLKRGIYHYRPDDHALEPVRGEADSGGVVRRLNGQPWFEGCSAVFFMTSVIRRVQWKYAFPRAYRVVLIEAGHFCQTFCLVATWMKLAPFCSAAFADSEVESALGVDGVNEVLLYAAGVGTRPPNVDEARWPSGTSPVLSAPAHLRRRGPSTARPTRRSSRG
jgi:SagB-type dehydrogenase family enzyme